MNFQNVEDDKHTTINLIESGFKVNAITHIHPSTNTNYNDKLLKETDVNK